LNLDAIVKDMIEDSHGLKDHGAHDCSMGSGRVAGKKNGWKEAGEQLYDGLWALEFFEVKSGDCFEAGGG